MNRNPSVFSAILTVVCVLASPGFARQTPQFTRADSLRGMPAAARTCYDISYYHLDVRIDPSTQFISGSNTIDFRVASEFDVMQIDLFANMNIDKILLDESTPATFTREFNAVFVRLPKRLPAGSRHAIRVFYSGKPQVARRPPWDGGFTWERDKEGNPWVAVTCQGTGASLWWPNKDHQADEPDSMLMSITVPKGLTDISNGRLRKTLTLPDGWTRFDWFISYPVNNYNVTVNIGKLAHFIDSYTSVTGEKLTLDYYVVPENFEKAKKVFQQVKPMMASFERAFGPYPFIRDGYKLVESPHTGMEHQTAVAYGNWYIGGYRGRAPSETGLKLDFIIIHESAHEWWGNSVSSTDIADMWIHESFGAYAEAVFVESQYGPLEALKYINGKKPNVLNDRPIIGIPNVQYRGSGDMYDKGQLVLNTLRSVIDNDSLWFRILRGIHERFKYQTINAEDVFRFINESAGSDYTYFFDQYFRQTRIPKLTVMASKKGDTVRAMYRWNAEAKDFRMPVKAQTSPGHFEWIHPTNSWQTVELYGMKPEDFKIAEDLFYVDVKLRWVYLDPSLK